MTLRFLLPERQNRPDVIVRVPTHIADPDRKPISHANHSELRDRVLLEELDHKLLGVAERQEVARRPEVFLRHSRREVQNKDQMSYDPPL